MKAWPIIEKKGFKIGFNTRKTILLQNLEDSWGAKKTAPSFSTWELNIDLGTRQEHQGEPRKSKLLIWTRNRSLESWSFSQLWLKMELRAPTEPTVYLVPNFRVHLSELPRRALAVFWQWDQADRVRNAIARCKMWWASVPPKGRPNIPIFLYFYKSQKIWFSHEIYFSSVDN